MHGPETPIVLGIDPGSRRSGYAVLTTKNGRPKIIEVGVIDLTASLDLEDRLLELSVEMADIIKQHRPTVAAAGRRLQPWQISPLSPDSWACKRGVPS